jgi:hypothetical protein
MSYRRAEACFMLLLGMALLHPGCSTSGIVGGDCRSGLSDCHGHCVDLASNPNHCGACGHRCPGGAACVAGVCPGAADAGGGGAAPDAEGPDASLDGGETDAAADTVVTDAPADTTPTDGPGEDASDAEVPEAGTDSGSDVEIDGCVEPYNTPEHCGFCDQRCDPTVPVCGQEFEGVWSCLPSCRPPLPDDCSGTCTDLDTDPFNCGSCGNVCPSGICSGGVCVGAGLGHVVLMCMDFAQSFRNQPPTTLLGNAVFLSAKQPVRVFAYNRYTVAAVQRQVNTTIGWAAPSPQSYSITTVNVDEDVPKELSPVNYEVFLVYDQPTAPTGALRTLGAAWAQALTSFAKAGGTVIVLDGGTGEMWDFLASAALLEVSGEVPLSGQLYVRAGTDALAQRTVSPFQALNRTCGFLTSIEPDFATVFVVTDTASGAWGNPVVVHRAIVP